MTRLNLGCGPNVFGGDWLNYDLEPPVEYLEAMSGMEAQPSLPAHQLKLIEWLASGGVHLAYHDMRQGLPTVVEPIRAIYLGQCVEHLNPYTELPKLLRDCREGLAPGGRLRITTPDMRMLLEVLYSEQMGELAARFGFDRKAQPEQLFAWLVFGVGEKDTHECYRGHMHLFTVDTLSLELYKAGFSEVHVLPEPSELFADVIDQGMEYAMGLEAVR